jgi:very-short-patch-repair endonuclease
MNEITKKLHDQVLKDFEPVAERLAREGMDAGQIAAFFDKQVRIKTAHYYEQAKGRLKSIKEIFQTMDLKQRADSKLEMIFYNLLLAKGIRFEFQRNIGPYRADFLFGGFLVVELDGPQHEQARDERRDEYMRRMGYKVLRVASWVLMMDPEAVIAEIVDQLPKAKVLKFRKKGA